MNVYAGTWKKYRKKKFHKAWWIGSMDRWTVDWPLWGWLECRHGLVNWPMFGHNRPGNVDMWRIG